MKFALIALVAFTICFATVQFVNWTFTPQGFEFCTGSKPTH